MAALSTELLQATATAAAAAAAAAASKPASSPTTSTPGSMPKSKFNSSPLFNAFVANKQKLTLPPPFSPASSLGYGSGYFGSPTSTSGTPPLTSGLSEISNSNCSLATPDHPLRLVPQYYSSSKVNSPLSNPGSAGPPTPGNGTSPTPAISRLPAPIQGLGNTTTNAPIHAPPTTFQQTNVGLGTGSAIWNSTMGSSHFSGYLNSLATKAPVSVVKGSENGEGLGFGRVK